MALIYERRNHKEDYFVYDYRKYIDSSGPAGSDNKLYVASTTTRITCPHLDDGVDWQAFNKWAFSSVQKSIPHRQ